MEWIELYARGSYFTVSALHQNDSVTANTQGVLGGGGWNSVVSTDLMPFICGLGAVHYATLLITYTFHLTRVLRNNKDSPWDKNHPHLESIFEMTVLSTLFWIAPAHISVFTYTLIFHAPRHIIRSFRFSPESLLVSRDENDATYEERPRSRLPLYILVSFGVMCAFALLDNSLGWGENLEEYIMPISNDGLSSPEAYLVLRMIVVGTSVLTTPHSFVVWCLRLKEKEWDTELAPGRLRIWWQPPIP